MVYRWRCQHCSFTVWSPVIDEIADAIASHLVARHHANAVTSSDFRVLWNCPYCSTDGVSYGREEGVDAFKDHLFTHAEASIKTDAHILDDGGGSGNALVLAPRGKREADNASVHLLSSADVLLFVTTNPADRIRLLDERFGDWPRHTIVLTTNHRPLEGLDDVDLSGVSVELVQLDKGVELSGLGQTISRIIDEHTTPGTSFGVGFDVLSDLIDSFELRKILHFLHLLTARLDDVGATTQYNLDPRNQPDPTIRLLENAFETTVRADGACFVSE